MSELGEFLRARRSQLTPAETGVPTYGTTRRVPGLRREEVALLAGVSATYYTRLEQGESHQMSDSVVEAIANALRLDDGERVHLRRLAWPAHQNRREAKPEEVRDSLLAVVENTPGQVAMIVGRYLDLLGGNRLAYALYGLRPGQRINMAHHMFLEPSMRDLVVDWPASARDVAAYLRMATGDLPDDPQLAEVIGALSIKSPEFAEIWATHPVAECMHGRQELDHPLVGRLTLTEETFRVPDDPGQRLIFLGATPGSDAAERLQLLDSLVS
ncbi:helix-turn-helix transcriptional regulator [Paractinoplanes globisporus]|uniref:Helix-turn-helix transcriptional regulator n=1 Tax=Paractinoplanes globisporus TaxID=113565 RepID=A0ABW6WLF0_9ACTN|nr:helix-turn-helix transcriptional regulator [Actinoplanes globisporus]